MGMRSAAMNDRSQLFVMSRHKNLQKKRKHEEARVNIVKLMDAYKDEYFNKYWSALKEKIYSDANQNDEDAVGLFSMNFLDDFDDAVFFNENDEKIQTGLESIQFMAKKYSYNFM